MKCNRGNMGIENKWRSPEGIFYIWAMTKKKFNNKRDLLTMLENCPLPQLTHPPKDISRIHVVMILSIVEDATYLQKLTE